MDLRDRLARVGAARAVLRDAEERTSRSTRGGALSGTRANRCQIGTDSCQIGTESPGSIAISGGAERGAAAYTSSEERHELSALGLEVVGLNEPDPLTLAHLGLRGEPPRRWEDVLFLDTETTGLSGGTGTYVFLLGTARIVDGELVLRQHLLRDLGGEREFVRAMHAELEQFRTCASYNGKAFDLPILRARVVMAMRSELSVDSAHLDLLHPARRLWRDRFGSTTLRQLEASVLDQPRGNDDVAGDLIPDRYFHYLRTRDETVIAPVLRHNARDVVSLVRITDRVALAVMAARAGRAPDHAPAALALARIFEQQGEADAAFCCYESAYADGDPVVRTRASLPLARALERRGELDRAVAMIETLLGLGLGTPTWRGQAEGRMRRLLKVTCTSRTSRPRRVPSASA